jgi:hypothetical protein
LKQLAAIQRRARVGHGPPESVIEDLPAPAAPVVLSGVSRKSSCKRVMKDTQPIWKCAIVSQL